MVSKTSKALCLVAVFCMSTSSIAMDSERLIAVKLKRQPLSTALITLGKQAEFSILFSPSEISSLTAPQIHGKWPIENVLERLLADTNLRFEFVSDKVISIHRQDEDAPDVSIVVNEPDKTEDKANTPTTQQQSLVAKPLTQQSEQSSMDVQDAIQGFEEGMERIVITGSRLKRGGSSTNIPVTYVDDSYLSLQGPQLLGTSLLTLPNLSSSLFSGPNSQAQTSGGAGLNFLNLRGLGFARTLVLVNGRRHVGARRGTSAVNINTIPENAIARIEISTGGASAVYGADAVSGVVNIITNTDFQGFKAEVSGSISSRSDAEQGKFSVSYGSSFWQDKAQLSVNALYENLDGVEAQQRSFASNGLALISNPEDRGPDDGIAAFVHRENVRFNAFSLGGAFNLAGEQFIFTEDGQDFRPFDFGEIGNRFGRQIGGDGVLFTMFDNLRLPTERSIVSSAFKYASDSGLNVFADIKYARTQTTQFLQPVEDPIRDGLIPLAADNPFLPQSLTERLLSPEQGEPINTLFINRVHTEFGRRGSINTRDTLQLTFGASSYLGNNWQYELFATYGQTDEDILSVNSRNTMRFFESVDAVLDEQSGQIVCRSADARARGCVPLNLVGRNNATQEAINFSRVDLQAFEQLTQTTAGASVTGTLAELSSGPLDIAGGVEYRKEFSRRRSSALQASGGSFLPTIPSNQGQYQVFEAFSEVKVPLVNKRPFVYSLSTEFAGRLSNYDTSGRVAAWHGIATYAPFKSMRFRVNRSRSVRAPNIGELFTESDSGFEFVIDPCDSQFINANPIRLSNCQAFGITNGFNGLNSVSKQVFFNGNPELQPEKSDTFTLGAVFTPEFVPGLSITADVWRVDIDDSINNPTPQFILNNCFDSEINTSENPFCALIERNGVSNTIASISSQESNIGRIISKGVDFDINYRKSFNKGFGGDFTFRLFGTYLDELISIGNTFVPDAFVDLSDVTGFPNWRANAVATYRTGPVVISWHSQFIDSSFISLAAKTGSEELFDQAKTDATLLHNFSVQYQANEYVTLSFNLANVFDTTPPERGFLLNQGRGGGNLFPNLGSLISFGISYQSK